MAEETVKLSGHPLDRQNEIERAIQLEGRKNPSTFKMPDGRTLSEVQDANQKAQDAEYQKEIKMVAERTREQSIAEFQKGDKLVMTSAGNLIDVTEPAKPKETMTLPTSRTTTADIEAGEIKPLREGTGKGVSPTGETATASGESLGTAIPATSTPPTHSTGNIGK